MVPQSAGIDAKDSYCVAKLFDQQSRENAGLKNRSQLDRRIVWCYKWCPGLASKQFHSHVNNNWILEKVSGIWLMPCSSQSWNFQMASQHYHRWLTALFLIYKTSSGSLGWLSLWFLSPACWRCLVWQLPNREPGIRISVPRRNHRTSWHHLRKAVRGLSWACDGCIMCVRLKSSNTIRFVVKIQSTWLSTSSTAGWLKHVELFRWHIVNGTWHRMALQIHRRTQATCRS